MTLDQVAKKVGIKQPAMSQIELGAINMSVTTARKLAKFYGVDLNTVFGWTGKVVE